MSLVEQLYRALVNMPCRCNLAYRRPKDTPIELCQRCAAVERYERELAETISIGTVAVIPAGGGGRYGDEQI